MKILVVDDDLALADVVAFTLRRAGFTVITAHDGLSALEDWQEQKPTLIILDLKLPKLDGLAVCRQIRTQSDIPIIILSVQADDDDVVAALEYGADDYITKPFSPRQLIARVKTVLRRVGVVHSPTLLSLSGLTLDTTRREVRLANQDLVHLTQLESRLLEVFMLNQGEVVTSDVLIHQVWGENAADKVMLKQLVHRLRQKIESTSEQFSYIETIPGVGYALIIPEN